MSWSRSTRTGISPRPGLPYARCRSAEVRRLQPRRDWSTLLHSPERASPLSANHARSRAAARHLLSVQFADRRTGHDVGACRMEGAAVISSPSDSPATLTIKENAGGATEVIITRARSASASLRANGSPIPPGRARLRLANNSCCLPVRPIALIADVDSDGGAQTAGEYGHGAAAVCAGVVEKDVEDLSRGRGRHRHLAAGHLAGTAHPQRSRRVREQSVPALDYLIEQTLDGAALSIWQVTGERDDLGDGIGEPVRRKQCLLDPGVPRIGRLQALEIQPQAGQRSPQLVRDLGRESFAPARSWIGCGQLNRSASRPAHRTGRHPAPRRGRRDRLRRSREHRHAAARSESTDAEPRASL